MNTRACHPGWSLNASYCTVRNDKPPRMRRMRRLIRLVVVSVFWLGTPAPVGAVSINSDVGLTPAKGQTVIRSQIRYTSKRDDPTTEDRNNWVLAIPLTVVYGFTQSVAGIVKIPYLHKELRSTSGGDRIVRQDAGVGDITLLAKGRVYTRDFPGATSRLSLLGGSRGAERSERGCRCAGEALTDAPTWLRFLGSDHGCGLHLAEPGQ